jgi:hypothetical protein
MIIVKKGCVNDIDQKTGKPKAYTEGQEFPRKVQRLIDMGILEEIEDKPRKNKGQEA